MKNQKQFKSRASASMLAAMSLLGVGAFVAGSTTADGQDAAQAQSPPRIVATSPKVGETDVDPGLTEITVTFDRDMAGGFSWTGGGADYPPGREGVKPQWRDKRTCVFPVSLQAGHYYRVGINSPSYRNFKSAEGVSAAPSAIYFTTKGASDELKRRVLKPMIVALKPLNGARDVDPNLTELRVTFNMAMDSGFSWTGGGPQFPTIPDGKKPFWTEDRKTCVLPVTLKAGTDYRVGLNSVSHKNFRTAEGIPLDPVSYSFKTRD